MCHCDTFTRKGASLASWIGRASIQVGARKHEFEEMRLGSGECGSGAGAQPRKSIAADLQIAKPIRPMPT